MNVTVACRGVGVGVGGGGLEVLTLRASLSGTFLQRKEGRKDVVNQGSEFEFVAEKVFLFALLKSNQRYHFDFSATNTQ